MSEAIADCQQWLERVVIGLNLCPFAKAVQAKNRLRWVACEADTLSEVLAAELVFLQRTPAEEVDTSLLVITSGCERFDDFLLLVAHAEALLKVAGYEGVFQLAHFHPRYQFADSRVNDTANNSNRSPWPIVHVLRESSISAVVVGEAEAAEIVARNRASLKALGRMGYKGLLQR
jgi:uncharacterized protein